MYCTLLLKIESWIYVSILNWYMMQSCNMGAPCWNYKSNSGKSEKHDYPEKPVKACLLV